MITNWIFNCSSTVVLLLFMVVKQLGYLGNNFKEIEKPHIIIVLMTNSYHGDVRYMGFHFHFLQKKLKTTRGV